ncbi:MAG: hypothetical protein HKP41_20675 [Desulfobacterales bacterium]|nr:glycogen-binding domain-containing protein [Deltaproteobacteria bacterium]NNK96773.1 hypothetical protein [Desulfobacterales bacterium]
MDHYISMYMDDELSLDEKILFVRLLSSDRNYADDALSMIEQEKSLYSVINHEFEGAAANPKKGGYLSKAGWAIAASLILFFSVLSGVNYHSEDKTQLQDISDLNRSTTHRFVLYLQHSSQVEILGSFTDWQKVPLHPTGTDGYWEVNLELPKGEHRYTFIVDNEKLMPDPTISARESDDFGSVNSILVVEG